MRHNPNNRNSHRGRLDSKRSRQYMKMFPAKKPRRKPCKGFDRPLMLDSSKIMDRVFAKLFDLDFGKLSQWTTDPMDTEFFVYDKYKTQAMVDMYNKL